MSGDDGERVECSYDVHQRRIGSRSPSRFIRSLVGLDQQAVNAKFAEFLDGTTATANQIDFIGLVVSCLTRHGAMEPSQLYDPPFTDNAPKGPDEFFPPAQMTRLVEIIRSINALADIQTPRRAAGCQSECQPMRSPS
jgi:type I restriction enzyme R subunit